MVALFEAAEAELPPTLRLLLLSKEAACERRWLAAAAEEEEEPVPAAPAVEAAWMLRAERLFCGLDDPRPGKELPRTEGAMMGAISSELEAELISLDLLPRPDCKTGALINHHQHFCSAGTGFASVSTIPFARGLNFNYWGGRKLLRS